MAQAAVLLEEPEVEEPEVEAPESVSTAPADSVPDFETIDFEQILGRPEHRDFRRPVVACNINLSLPI